MEGVDDEDCALIRMIEEQEYEIYSALLRSGRNAVENDGRT